jgi:hypothetical protein
MAQKVQSALKENPDFRVQWDLEVLKDPKGLWVLKENLELTASTA